MLLAYTGWSEESASIRNCNNSKTTVHKFFNFWEQTILKSKFGLGIFYFFYIFLQVLSKYQDIPFLGIFSLWKHFTKATKVKLPSQELSQKNLKCILALTGKELYNEKCLRQHELQCRSTGNAFHAGKGWKKNRRSVSAMSW